jgi:Xaa-Pro dipeptidase
VGRRPQCDPQRSNRAILDEHKARGQRLGVEWDAYGLTAVNGRKLTAALDGFFELEDASDLVTRQRAVKRPAEIPYVRKAAELADAALAAALPLIRPNAWEGDILAALQASVLAQDGDYAGNEFIIGSGPGQNLGRYVSGRRRLEADHTIAIEFAGVFHPARRRLRRHLCSLYGRACRRRPQRHGKPAPHQRIGKRHPRVRDTMSPRLSPAAERAGSGISGQSRTRSRRSSRR